MNRDTTAVVAVGDKVRFEARIRAASPTSLPPDGSITISDSTNGAIRYGSAPITKDPNSNDARATIDNDAIPVGSYVLVATYGGDNQGKYYNGAQSNTVSLQVQNKLGQSPQPSLAINATSGGAPPATAGRC